MLKKYSVFTLIFVIIIMLAGCGSSDNNNKNNSNYSVSGYIFDSNNNPVSDVTLHFSGGLGTTQTNSEGYWRKDELNGTVTITPAKDGYIFEPSSQEVNAESNDINFVMKGEPIYTDEQIQEYNQIKREIFNGWFSLTPKYGYDDPTMYLGYGERTKITDITYNAIKNTRNSLLTDGVTHKQNIEAIIELLHLPYEWDLYNSWYEYDSSLDRFIGTTEWYIENETLVGVCVDRASTIAALFRASGIPAIYVEAVGVTSVGDFIDNGKVDGSYEPNYGRGYAGHAYVEVYIEGKWCLVDANSGNIYLDYDNTSPYLEEEIIIIKSMDNWEYWKTLGYDNHPYMATYQEENIPVLKELFDNFVSYESSDYINAWETLEKIY